MPRTITTHPSAKVNFTSHARDICQELNEYMRWVPGAKFKDACDWWNRVHKGTEGCRWGLSYESLRRYYTGSYALNNNWGRGPRSATLVRLGACVEL